MRHLIMAAAIVACDRNEGRPIVTTWPGIHVPEDSTGASTTGGDLPRLDLPAWPDLPGEATGTTTTGEGATTATSTSGGTSTGDASTGGSSTGPGGTSTTDTSGTSAGDTSSGDGSTSTTGEALSLCPCTAEAMAAKNFCGLVAGTCEPTMPGGYCDPNGDGSYDDGDWNLGWQEWTAKCA